MQYKNNHPKRLKRSESFFGIHFDFHARKDSTSVGERVTSAMVENIIELVRPDYIQCDCKGHYGYSSYPTNVGYRALGIVGDSLTIWREVTARYGVALYMHYSGVWDDTAIRHHPDWARIDEHDTRDPSITSTFGSYVDQLLIPQLKELSDRYEVDGAWIDGDCWATRHDYGEQVINAFRKMTGIENSPRTTSDPYFAEFTEFCRDGFRRYLRHYVDELHQHNPAFQITSNWAFSSKMPEPVSANVDFLSGDYWLINSVNSARFEGRCLRHQGMPWDLMAWSFSGQHVVGDNEEDFSTKSVPQLQREAALVLALGGGFQAYFQQDRNGAIYPWQMQLMREVATFCRARQEFCHRAEHVPQIAMLYANTTLYRQTQALFDPHNGELRPMQGILQALLEQQHVVDIVMEHQLLGHMADYPLIIVPEWGYLEETIQQELVEYVEQGGNLLLIGPQTAALFERELGITLEGIAQDEQAMYLEQNGWLARIKTRVQQVQLHQGTTAFGHWYSSNDMTGPTTVAASLTTYGQGKIAATYFNFGNRYTEAATTVARDFLAALIRELFPEPLVTVDGSRFVDVTVTRVQGKLAVNVVNTAGPHADSNVHVFDDIPVVGPLTITIRCSEQPHTITLQPENRDIPFTWKNGKATILLSRLEIHNILIIK